MHVFGDDAELTVEYDSSIPGLDLPASMSALYLAFVVEKARLMTAQPMVPVAATLRADEDARHTLARHLGVMPRYGEKATLSFRSRRCNGTISIRGPRVVGGDGTGSRTTTCRASPHQQHVRQGLKRAADTTAVGQTPTW